MKIKVGHTYFLALTTKEKYVFGTRFRIIELFCRIHWTYTGISLKLPSIISLSSSHKVSKFYNLAV